MKKKEIKDYLKHEKEIRKLLSSAKITVKCPVYDCEDPDKVASALSNVVNLKPTIQYYSNMKYMVIETSGYEYVYKIFNHFRNRRVLAALRKYLFKYIDKDTIVLYLHKQAAYVGVLSLAEPGESPLGEIRVEIKTEKPGEIVRWLTRF